MALLDDDPELDLYDQRLGHPHPVRGARAGQGRPDRAGPPQPDQPRLRDRRDGRQLASCRRACGSTSGPSCATRSSCSTRSSARARSSTARSSTRRSSSARARSSATGPYDDRPNTQEPGRLNTGITVVGKRAVIPRGVRIGRNVKVAADVRPSDFAERVVRSGESVEVERRPRARTAARRARRRPATDAVAGAAARDVADRGVAGVGEGVDPPASRSGDLG